MKNDTILFNEYCFENISLTLLFFLLILLFSSSSSHPLIYPLKKKILLACLFISAQFDDWLIDISLFLFVKINLLRKETTML